jgi:serine O-acetyltransferase
MNIDYTELGSELRIWFQKSIIEYSCINFEDHLMFENVLDLFLFDYQRYFPTDKIILVEKIKDTVPLQAILTYRIANYYFKYDEKLALKYSNLGRYLTGIEIFYTAKIGRGLKINHGIGTVIGARSVIGENLLIHQNVTIGDKNEMRPTIGNNVTIYAGAKILGGIKIHDNVVIGANCVCYIDIPYGKKAVGIPARIID